MSNPAHALDPIMPFIDGAMTSVAAGAVAAVVEGGAKNLIAEPWRVARIVRGADGMTFDELAGHLARRRRAAPFADLNGAIALAQLCRALQSPRFSAAWDEWRSSAQ